MPVYSLLSAITVSFFCLLLSSAAAAYHVSHVGYSHIGCFVDCTNGVRDFTGLVGITEVDTWTMDPGYHCAVSNNMTLDVCRQICSLGGFQYFGVQSYSYCFCGDSYGSQGKAATDGECNSPCGGNSAQMCGGTSRNSVFALNYPSTFIPADRLDVVSIKFNGTYSQPLYRTISPRGEAECFGNCNAGCQGVIFSKQQGLCHLLRFAFVPPALMNSTGDFYVRF